MSVLAGPPRCPLPGAPRPPAAIALGGGSGAARHGVTAIDLRFPRGAPARVQEIVFRNFYTAFVSVRVQRPGARRWVTVLRDHRLMPSPHAEDGAQDYFSLHRHQMLCDVEQVTAMRFILRQPSPVWLNFTIEELQIFPLGQKSSPKDFPSWLSQLTPPEQPPSLHGRVRPGEHVQRGQQAGRGRSQPRRMFTAREPHLPGRRPSELPDPEKVSTEVQQMWVLTEVIRARQAAARIGRFDVDGCYDINLLSYT
ncbi:nicolin-1 isoform X1 [Cuculus canorus]|uniref:nicolin-1 isoform X1 n=1 Tax=Cuculus canorus TaxID=55661 RepID=UPI0023AB07E3|nr:nicolin-1 isoform X1 [Cuculus canorus]